MHILEEVEVDSEEDVEGETFIVTEVDVAVHIMFPSPSAEFVVDDDDDDALDSFIVLLLVVLFLRLPLLDAINFLCWFSKC